MELIIGLFLVNLVLAVVYSQFYKEKIVDISGFKITIMKKYLFHKQCYQVYSKNKFKYIDSKEYFYTNGGKVGLLQEFKINDMIDEYHLRKENDLPI